MRTLNFISNYNKRLQSLYQDVEAQCKEAKRYLTEPVQNPVNLTEKTIGWVCTVFTKMSMQRHG